MFTQAELESSAPESIIASGTADLVDPWTGETQDKRYVVVRGGIADWAMYVGDVSDDDKTIAQWGNKLHDEDTIQRVLGVDDETMESYRH